MLGFGCEPADAKPAKCALSIEDDAVSSPPNQHVSEQVWTAEQHRKAADDRADSAHRQR